MNRWKKRLIGIAKWLTIGVALCWVQAALAAWLFAPPTIPWPTYPGLPVGVFRGAGGQTRVDDSFTRTLAPDDLGALGRVVAETFYHGSNTVFAHSFDPADQGPYYQIAVERYGWPVACWDAWHGVNDQVLWGIPVSGPKARKNNGPISSAPLALPVLPLVETVWLSSAVWGAVAFGGWRLVRRTSERLRRPPGTCVSCGYNRAGLAKGAPCPECGS